LLGSGSGILIAHRTLVTNQPSTVRQDFDKLRADLRQLAETMRLKVHLAGMEAKDAWGALEPKVDAFERKAEAIGAEIAHDIKDAGVELKHALEKLTKAL